MSVGTVKLTGMRELARAIDKLPKELQRRAESSAIRGGCKPILKAAKGNVAKDTGLLKKSLGNTVRTVRGKTTGRVGPRRGFKKTVTRNGKSVVSDPTKYAHLVEYGTSHSAAKPFIRPAIESTEGQVVAEMASAYNKNLDRVVAKIRSRK